jgi:hypothetical protein
MALDPKEHYSNEVHNLDDVNSRLYRRDLADRKGKRIDSLHYKPVPVQADWTSPKDTPQKSKKEDRERPSVFKKFFYFSLSFAGIAVIFAAIMFLTGGNTVSNTDIEINVLGTSFASGGEELPLQVEIVNKNQSTLELADLFVEYNKGGDSTSGAKHVRELNSLGTITAGKTITKSLFVTLYGQEGSVQDVTFTLQYRLRGSNAIFVKKNVFPVTINSAPVALSVEAPSSVTPNQTMTFTVKTVSNAKNPLSGMLLRVDYPNGFKFEKAVPSPDAYTNVWKLGDLAPGAEREIVITGTVYGTDGEDRAFHVYTGSASANDSTKIGVTYNSMLSTIALVKPFLSANLALNGSSDATIPVDSASTVSGTIRYSNNLSTQVTNAEITLALSGNALDPAGVSAQDGFYDSSRKIIIWNGTTDKNLASIQPGDQGTLSFTLTVLPLLSASSPVSSPSIKLAVSIKGTQPQEGGTASEVKNFETHTAVVSSDLGFAANAFYASGPFSNTGSIPPKAGTPTTYTITWSVTNSSNPLATALATAALPPYVDWVGTISPTTAPLTFDPGARTVRWNIGSVPPGTGLSGPSKSVSFQVRLNPSTSQVGSIPKLVLDTAVTARDTFTGEALTMTRPAVSTVLENDGGFSSGGGIVTN